MQPPHFFKPVLPTAIREEKLLIPKKFVKEYGKDLSDKAILKVPTGKIWQVEMKHCEGGYWLQNGWKQFADYYSIGIGYFLVFRYEGKSKFHVLIFDRSATEIDYPPNATKAKDLSKNEAFRLPKMQKTEEDDVSVEIVDKFTFRKAYKKENTYIEKSDDENLNDIPPRQATLKKSRSPSHQSAKRPRRNPTCETAVIRNQPKGNQPNWIRHSNLKEPKDEVDQVMLNPRRLPKVIKTRRPPTMEKLGVLERAEAFKSKNPFFIIKLHRTYVTKSFVHIPYQFAKRFFSETHKEVVLQVMGGRSCSVSYWLGKTRASFQYGWRAFLQENHLVLGDVCVFELIKDKKNSMRVFLFREGNNSSKEKSHAVSCSSCYRRKFTDKVDQDNPITKRSISKDFRKKLPPTSVLQRAEAFKSKNPFFMVKLQPTHITRSQMRIPCRFGERYLSKMHKEVILRVSDGRSWSVKYYWLKDSYAHFGSGWKAFVEDNHLNVGDFCVFEMLKDIDQSMRVFIYRDVEVV